MQITNKGGATCDGEINYSATIQLYCDRDATPADPLKILGVDETNKCNPILKVSSQSACPVFSAGTYTEFLLDRPWILSPLLIIFGIAVTLVGRKFFAWTIGILGLFSGFGVTMLLFSMLDMLDY